MRLFFLIFMTYDTSDRQLNEKGICLFILHPSNLIFSVFSWGLGVAPNHLFKMGVFRDKRGDQLPVEPIAHAVIIAMFDVGGQDRRPFSEQPCDTWEEEDSNRSFFFYSVKLCYMATFLVTMVTFYGNDIETMGF